MDAQDAVADVQTHVITPVLDVVVDVLDAGEHVKQAAEVDVPVDVLAVADVVAVDHAEVDALEDAPDAEAVVDVIAHVLVALEDKEVYLNGKLWF